MSEDMVQLAKKYVGNISAKGLLYAEAIDMLVKGHQMVQAGTEALQHLEGRKPKSKSTGYGGTQGGLLIKAEASVKSPKTNHRETRTEEELAKAISKAIGNGERTAKELAAKVGCGYARVLETLNNTSGIERVGVGNQIRWVLKGSARETSKLSRKQPLANRTLRAKKTSKTGAKQALCKPADPEQQAKDEDKIISLLKDTPGLSIGPIMKKMKRSFYPLQRAIKACVKDGRLKPSQVTLDSGRKLATWVPA
jgi:hypothetical protein